MEFGFRSGESGSKFTVISKPLPKVDKIPQHKRYEGPGKKDTTFINEIWIEQPDAKSIADVEAISSILEITLMDWGKASVEEIKEDSDGNVTDLKGVLHPKGFF